MMTMLASPCQEHPHFNIWLYIPLRRTEKCNAMLSTVTVAGILCHLIISFSSYPLKRYPVCRLSSA